MYRLVPLAEKRDNPDKLEEIDDIPHFIEGEIENYIIVSVPPDITPEMMSSFAKRAMDSLGRPCIVIGHNISLLRAKKLKASDAATLLRRIDNAEENPSEENPDSSGEERVGGSTEAESSGD